MLKKKQQQDRKIPTELVVEINSVFSNTVILLRLKKHKALSKNRGRNILGHKSITPYV